MMTSRGSRWDERGQSTLEFIIIMPMMFLMISLILYAGWWSYGKLSAQNAAYSYAVWAPLEQPILQGGRLANYDASNATLGEPIGMKAMWSEDITNPYDADRGSYSRLGGTGVTIAVSPQGLSWEEYLDIYDALELGSMSVDLPRGTAFFFYSPLISADVDAVP